MSNAELTKAAYDGDEKKVKECLANPHLTHGDLATAFRWTRVGHESILDVLWKHPTAQKFDGHDLGGALARAALTGQEHLIGEILAHPNASRIQKDYLTLAAETAGFMEHHGAREQLESHQMAEAV